MNANKKLYVDTKSDKNSGRNRRSIDFERSEVDPKRYYGKADLEQAERTAWKCLKDWVDAQMALIQLGLANMDEVFMPYIMDRNGNTLYEIAKERRFLLDCGNK